MCGRAGGSEGWGIGGGHPWAPLHSSRSRDRIDLLPHNMAAAAAATARAAPSGLARRQLLERSPVVASAGSNALARRSGVQALAAARSPRPCPFCSCPGYLAGPRTLCSDNDASAIACASRCPSGLTSPPPPPHRRRQPLCAATAAGQAGAAGSPSAGLEALHNAVERGDLRGVQTAIEQLQHPEQELDVLLVRGNGIPQAAIHRAAQGGKETCMKVQRDGVVVQDAGPKQLACWRGAAAPASLLPVCFTAGNAHFPAAPCTAAGADAVRSGSGPQVSPHWGCRCLQVGHAAGAVFARLATDIAAAPPSGMALGARRSPWRQLLVRRNAWKVGRQDPAFSMLPTHLHAG